MCSSVHMHVQMLPYILSVMDIHLDFVFLVNIMDYVEVCVERSHLFCRWEIDLQMCT